MYPDISGCIRQGEFNPCFIENDTVDYSYYLKPATHAYVSSWLLFCYYKNQYSTNAATVLPC